MLECGTAPHVEGLPSAPIHLDPPGLIISLIQPNSIKIRHKRFPHNGKLGFLLLASKKLM